MNEMQREATLPQNGNVPHCLLTRREENLEQKPQRGFAATLDEMDSKQTTKATFGWRGVTARHSMTRERKNLCAKFYLSAT